MRKFWFLIQHIFSTVAKLAASDAAQEKGGQRVTSNAWKTSGGHEILSRRFS